VCEVVKRANLQSQQVDECIISNVMAAGSVSAVRGWATEVGAMTINEVGAMTINMVCGSGEKAVALAALACCLPGPTR
jgi:acetyl-CoA C-acetyltransferase